MATEIARELGRASSFPVTESADQAGGRPPRESTAIPKLPAGKARGSAGSIPRVQQKRRRQVGGNELDSEGPSDER